MPLSDRPTPTADLTAGPLVAGGRAISRTDAGEVVFVAGALPGERVRVELGAARSGWREGTLLEVLEPSEARVVPRCRHVADGCGGCDLAMVAGEVQPSLKVEIVADALRRIGGIDDPPAEAGPALPTDNYRTTVRAVVVDGRAALRRRASHDPIVLDECLVAHPLVEEILLDGRFPGAEEIIVRAGALTGERMVAVTPNRNGVVVPDDCRVVGEDEIRSGRKTWYHEVVGGRRFRVSSRSFFQSSQVGAEAIATEVQHAAGGMLRRAERVLDAYCGVGVLGGLLVAAACEAGGSPDLLAVEHTASSVRDAQSNLGSLDLDVDIDLLKSSIESMPSERADLVIADPSRKGLGKKAAVRLSATGAEVIVLVSCDAASLGRDAGLLADLGFRLERARVIDLFPQTSHVEVVSRFVRGALR